MRGRSPTTLLIAASLVAVLSLALSPVAHRSTALAAGPTDLCGLLTPDEIATALKVEAADGSGGDQFCSWYMGGTELDVLVDAGSLEATRAGTSGYTDITVAGHPALLANAGDTWLVIAIDGGTLSLHLFRDPGTGVHVSTAVEALGAIALGRMAGLGVAPTTPTPAPTAGVFCGILTADEVSAALTKKVVVVQSGQDQECEYYTDASGAGDQLVVYQGLSTFAELKADPLLPVTDVVVAGQPALLNSRAAVLYVETPDGWVLEMHLFSDVLDEAAGASALEALAADALGRASSFPLPVKTEAPVPTAAADPALAALFPATVGGQPFPVRALTDEELTPYYDVMGGLGLGMEDVTFAMGSNAAGSVMALRTNGQAAANLVQDFVPALAGDMADPQQTPTAIANRAVIKVTDGPDSGAPGGVYIASNDEVIWAIKADEPALSEIIGALPLPSLPPPSPSPGPSPAS
jgi:hypothetical protein